MFGIASNSYGIQSVSIETSISHTKKVESGDILIATSKEINKTTKTALYYITITNQKNEKIAFILGALYIEQKKNGILKKY